MIKTKQIYNDGEKALSILLEYVLLSILLVVFMYAVLTYTDSTFVKNPTHVAMSNQFEDIGNEIATKLIDTALIAPENGNVRVKLFMPYSVGDYDFKAEFVQRSGQYLLEVKSEMLNRTEIIPLNNIALEVMPEGSTFSLSINHQLTYSSELHTLPTAIALAYPSTVSVNSNVTFDVTYSTGEGQLSFRWEFGDGQSYTGVFNPSDPDTALVEHSFSSEGNYTANLTVWDNFGYYDTDSVNITVLPSSPDPYLYVDKMVVPRVSRAYEDVKITLFIRGGGTVQEPRNVSVMHVIDVSGSMEPDYYEYFWGASYRHYGYTPFSTESGYALPSKWNETVEVDNSFQKLRVDAYSTGKDIDLWVKSPDGDFARAQYSITNGERFEVTSPVSGEWEIAVVADYPTGSDSVTVDVFKYSGGWNLVSTYNFELAADPETFQIDINAEDLKIEVDTINGSKELHLWVREPSGSLEGYYSSSSGEYYEDSSAEQGTYTAYVVADFPYGNQEFELTAYIAKIDAAKIAAKTFNGFLNTNDRVGVAYFNGTDECLKWNGGYCKKWCYGCLRQAEVIQGLTNNPNSANASIDTLVGYGGTPMGDGIWVAKEELVSNTPVNSTPVIILLSDGNPTLPFDDPVQLAIDNATDAKNTIINGDNILLYTIGFGNDANETLLRQIATSPDYYHFAASAEELQSIYEDIARELKEKAAMNITVTDVLPEDIELSDIPEGATVVYDNGYTFIKWNISAIRINETWTASFYVKPEKEGNLQTNVYGLSNITYLPYPFTGVPIRTYYLPTCVLRVERLESERVELR